MLCMYVCMYVCIHEYNSTYDMFLYNNATGRMGPGIYIESISSMPK
jgi:hypothetical protein